MCNSCRHQIASDNWALLQSFPNLGQRIVMFEALVREHKLNPNEVAALVPVCLEQLDGSRAAAICLLTGFSRERLDELGGV